ncbi:MAG: hypothetical protein Q9215_007794 [Flavoplaca cf. flavocitrina]
MGLELTSSAFTPRAALYQFYGEAEKHYQEVMPASAFQKCDDVINDGVELLLKAGCSFDRGPGYYSLNNRSIFAFAVGLLALNVSRFATLKLQSDYFEVVEIIIKNLALRRGNTVPSMIDAQIAELICIRSIPVSNNEWEHAAWWRIRWFWKNVPPKDFPVPVSREIIRLGTFERLGLRHTCCDYVDGVFETVEPAEADEIRDEDRDGIQLLESLLPEFEEKLGDEDIKSFIDGYWSTRMEEVLAARDEESVDRAGLREAGVVLCDDDGSDDDGSDDLFRLRMQEKGARSPLRTSYYSSAKKYLQEEDNRLNGYGPGEARVESKGGRWPVGAKPKDWKDEDLDKAVRPTFSF